MNNYMYIPAWLKSPIRAIILFFRILPQEFYWVIRIIKYNNWSKNKDADLDTLLIISHVLEKGLTMPNRRLGFGQNRVKEVIAHCNKCINRYGAECAEVQFALNDLHEYDHVHKTNCFKLPDDIQKELDNILLNHQIEKYTGSLEFTKSTFFKNCNSFTEFAKSRHTCRHYSSEPVKIEILQQCIELAQTAPSACNRQGTKVYIIASEKGKSIVRKYQNGSRGFGEYADKFILITADQYAWDIRQIKSGLIDAGIFTMNLLYALHEQHIAACTLNAHLNAKQLAEFYKELPICQNELPVIFIAIGNVPDKFSVARSGRKQTNDIINEL